MFKGIHAVQFAMFHEDETIDANAMTAQVGFCLDAGCNGITVLGLATEVLKLTPNERRQIIEIVAPSVVGKVPFSVTIAGNSVAEQTEMARIAVDHGADWLILQPPMAGSYEAAVYLDFFVRVANSVEVPVAIQNAPQYLGRGLSGEDIAELGRLCPNLAAIKAEDDAEGLAAFIELAGDDLGILGGRGGLEMIACLKAGVTGFVLAPDIIAVACRILEHWNAQEYALAETLFEQANPGIEFTMQSLEHFIAYGKRNFAEQAGLIVHDRAPAQEICSTDLERMVALTQKL